MKNEVSPLNNVDSFGTQKTASGARNAKSLFRGQISQLTTSSLMRLAENQACQMLRCCAGRAIQEKEKNDTEQGVVSDFYSALLYNLRGFWFVT